METLTPHLFADVDFTTSIYLIFFSNSTTNEDEDGFPDNLGSIKDAVKDIMIAGMELVDMINNWKDQP